MFKVPSWEALKELFRLVFFWVVSTLVAAALQQLAGWHLPPFFAEALTAFLRSVDKWVHEKQEGFFENWKGLSPF